MLQRFQLGNGLKEQAFILYRNDLPFAVGQFYRALEQIQLVCTQIGIVDGDQFADPVFESDGKFTSFAYNHELNLKGINIIDKIRLPDFKVLENFVNAFNEGIDDLSLNTIISPIKTFGLYEQDLKRNTAQILNQKLHAIEGDPKYYRPEPGFIVAHKALIMLLAGQ